MGITAAKSFYKRPEGRQPTNRKKNTFARQDFHTAGLPKSSRFASESFEDFFGLLDPVPNNRRQLGGAGRQ
jgi:hypothetical protein